MSVTDVIHYFVSSILSQTMFIIRHYLIDWSNAMAFFELRQYKIRPGKMAQWLDFMENEIIPFQVSKGAVICGSFQGEEDDSVYFWIRRFESEAERERLYEAVYQSDFWTKEVAPKVGELIDREAIQVQRVNATRLSTMQ